MSPNVWRLVVPVLAALVLAGCVASDGVEQAPGQETTIMGAPLQTSSMGSYLAGRVARLERDTESAARLFGVALDEDPGNPRLIGRTLQMVLAEGDLERAFTLAERRLESRQSDSTARLVLAVRALKAGDGQGAKAQMAKARNDGIAALVHPMLNAWINVELGDADAANEALEALASRDVFDPFRLFHGALVNDVLGGAEKAEAYYREMLDDNGRVATRVVLAYGAHLTARGERDKAKDLLTGYLRDFPENSVIVQALKALEVGGAPQPPVTDASEGAAEAFLGAAGALARDRTSQAAIVYLRLALYLRPQLDAALMLLGDVLEVDGRYEASNNAYQGVPPNSPYYWDARIRVASNLNRMDKVDETLRLLRELAAQRADDTTALAAAGDILRSRERYDEAVADYDLAIGRIDTLDERHWALLYARGIALERSKQWPRAEKDFLKALELRPEHPLVLNYLGYSWIEKGLNIERARGMIERAVEQRPDDGYIVDSLGWVMFRIGEFDEAVRHLERAVELRPEDPVINDHLGDAYWRTGRQLEARFQWSHALALGAEPEEAVKIRDKLQFGLPPLATVSSGT